MNRSRRILTAALGKSSSYEINTDENINVHTMFQATNVTTTDVEIRERTNNCQTVNLYGECSKIYTKQNEESLEMDDIYNQANKTCEKFDSNRRVEEYLNTLENKNQTTELQDFNDLITMSDLEDSDDSVIDPNFIPDIISNSESSDDELIQINFRHDLLKKPKIHSLPVSIENIQNSISTHKINFDFVAAYPGPIIIAKNFNVDENYLTAYGAASDIEQNAHETVLDIDYNAHEALPDIENNAHGSVSVIKNNVNASASDNKQKLKHPIKDIICKCSRQCSKFTSQDRQNIWNQYWDLKCKSRRLFLYKCVSIQSIKRRKVKKDDNVYTKKESRYYSLPKMINDHQEYVPVCKQFLLNTLGYTNDSVITELCKSIKSGTITFEDKRGGAKKKVERNPIKEHIMSYHPVQSHYRRHNAPITRYLPRHLTTTEMFKDFKAKHPSISCGAETYRKTMKKMKVSLYMPKSDACVDCQTYNDILAFNNNDESQVNEELKNKYNNHKTKAESAVKLYRMNAQSGNTIHSKFYSMDLQKVILLPEMPQIKESHFVSRLTTYNLTFAPIQPQSNDLAVCVLWHEALGGRDAANIIDALWAFLESERNVKNIYLWADNCTAQNKNWFLYTALVIIVNSPENEIENITISYLTKGHTHMSADSVHGNIDKKMHRNLAVFDFDDFKNIVLQARSKIKIIEPKNRYKWPKKKRSPRINSDPLKDFQLGPVVQVKFVRGLRQLLFKTSFADQLSALDFLVKKFDTDVWPAANVGTRGVKTEKKQEILTKLVPLMPESRKKFWRQLPESDQSSDLVDDEELDDCEVE